jgi:hypothetical protein
MMTKATMVLAASVVDGEYPPIPAFVYDASIGIFANGENTGNGTTPLGWHIRTDLKGQPTSEWNWTNEPPTDAGGIPFTVLTGQSIL